MKKEDFDYLIKEQRYIGCIFRYGILTMLLLLDELEHEGNYEECDNIVNAIQYINKHMKDSELYQELPTQYNGKELQKLNEFNLHGSAGKVNETQICINMNAIKDEVEL